MSVLLARWLGAGMILAAAMLPAGVALGQEVEDEGPMDPPVEDTRSLGLGSVERDLELYWGGKRDVSAVEDKLYRKAGRLELGLQAGLIPNDPFYTYIPVGARVGYFFGESLGVEVGGVWHGSALQSASELTTFLVDARGVTEENDLRDIQQWRASAVVVWSPFYGKMALLDDYLSHFDINLAAGLGVVQTESPTVDRDGTQTEIKPEGALGAGFRFFLTDWFALRLDYRQGIFQKVGGGVSTPSELTLGLSFFTGG